MRYRRRYQNCFGHRVVATVAFCVAVVGSSVWAQSGQRQAVVSARAVCHQLGRTMKERLGGLCGRPVHWCIAVDTSESMGGKLDFTKRLLGEWIPNLAAPGDRITLLSFSKYVREEGSWAVTADRDALTAEILDHLKLVKGVPGSTLQGARRAVLEKASQSEARYQAVSLVLSDRDDPDAIPAEDAFTAGLRRQFGESLWAGGSEGGAGASVEGIKQFVVTNQGNADAHFLVAIYSGQRRVPAATNAEQRWLPLPAPRIVPGYTPPDPAEGLRALLRIVPPLILGVALACVWLLTRATAGWLVKVGGMAGESRLPLRWWPLGRKSCAVVASNSADGFHLPPTETTHEGVHVLDVDVEGALGIRRPWTAVLRMPTGDLEIRLDKGEWAQEQTIHGETRQVDVRKQKELASAALQFRENRRTRALYMATLVLLITGVIALVLSPIISSQMAPPPPTLPTTVEREQLC